MDINAFKMDGLGNDFIIIDRRKNPISINKEKIIELGRRDNIGFDQLIFIDQINNDAKDHNPITIFNSDGLEVEACGNGSRCVAKILCDEQKKDEIKIITSNRWKKIPLSKDVDHKNINLKINHMELKEGFAVNVGNPHVVFFVKDCFKYNLKEIGPIIENHELFPEKVNVTFAQIKDAKNILVNVWERGAGLTKACGTAACATGVVAFEKKLSGNNTNIHFKEGFLNIEYNGSISMTGPVSDIEKVRLKL